MPPRSSASRWRANGWRSRAWRRRRKAPCRAASTTVGGVVAPGGAVLDITLAADRLVVEAQLAPDLIDVVHSGLAARVHVTAYKVRRHFTLRGTVTQVSSDTFKEERSGRSY